MAARSVLAIDVDDKAFKEFKALFDKYQEQLKKLPGAWGATDKRDGRCRARALEQRPHLAQEEHRAVVIGLGIH